MSATDLLLAVMALCVGLALAWRSGRGTKLVLFVSAMVVSGLLFLPGSQLSDIAGDEAVRRATALAAQTPWTLSDWMHFAIFAWLGLLLWLGRPDLRGWKGLVTIAVLAVAAELAQWLTVEREARLDDVFLNLAGGMAGVLLGVVAGEIWRRSTRNPMSGRKAGK